MDALLEVSHNFSWTCPFCNRPVTITRNDICMERTRLDIKNTDGYRVAACNFMVCSNPECKKFSLLLSLYDAYMNKNYVVVPTDKILNTWRLIPHSKAQSFPDYIPKAILGDYNEACLIIDLSPKASASLSRRCLQGMIRDFWSVVKRRLIDEIDGIKDKVDEDTWEAIDAVRSVGNIGAHMEKDVNLIIDVEPNEAKALIKLIEILLKDWYIARAQKKLHLEAVKKLAEDKQTLRNQGTSTAT